MADLKGRPRIPLQIQRELWARAAGRCEFRGCNKCIYKDGTTQRSRNSSEIAHIISWKSTGPRGNEDSSKLATDISNLMLVCPEHNNLIDDPKYIDKFPVELLREMKAEHENRVFHLTGLGQDYSLRVIELVSKIQGQTPTIDLKDEIEALLPYYPMEENIGIDLSGIENINDAMRRIDQSVSLYVDGADQKSYAVFIMCQIPYSCYLGYRIGDKRKTRSFQYFRDTCDWKWRETGGHIGIIYPEEKSSADINLLINISGIIQAELIPKQPSYIIQADEPSVYFLQSEEQITEFRMRYRETLDLIRARHGEDVKIHLFVAAPNSITFEIGRSIMKNLDPTIILYDKVPNDIKYKEIMPLHKRVRDI